MAESIDSFQPSSPPKFNILQNPQVANTLLQYRIEKLRKVQKEREERTREKEALDSRKRRSGNREESKDSVNNKQDLSNPSVEQILSNNLFSQSGLHGQNKTEVYSETNLYSQSILNNDLYKNSTTNLGTNLHQTVSHSSNDANPNSSLFGQNVLSPLDQIIQSKTFEDDTNSSKALHLNKTPGPDARGNPTTYSSPYDASSSFSNPKTADNKPKDIIDEYNKRI